MKPLLVGEANPHGGDPEFAFYPYPPGCAGHRLCYRVLGLSEDEYLERFDRANLCPEKWSLHEARRRADELSREARTFVLCGAKVAAAFAWVLGRQPSNHPQTFSGEFAPFSHHFQIDCPERRYVVLPHPSGLCRAWGEPGAYDRARRVLRSAGVLDNSVEHLDTPT